jgi:hypothetical protein
MFEYIVFIYWYALRKLINIHILILLLFCWKASTKSYDSVIRTFNNLKLPTWLLKENKHS